VCVLLLDLEWKMIYVGSAESEEHDQILDTICVGPIPEGKHMFVFQVWWRRGWSIPSCIQISELLQLPYCIMKH